MSDQLAGLTEWVKTQPPEVVAARLKQLDDALGVLLDEAETERERHGRQGDPGRAEAKSSPEFRPETPPRSVSAIPSRTPPNSAPLQ